jgi:uncharacterized protein (UPF0276 family)
VAEFQAPVVPPLVAEISWTKLCVIMENRQAMVESEFYTKMTKRYGCTKDVLINNIKIGIREVSYKPEEF